MTPELVGHIQHYEGWVAAPYHCPAGYLTIGYGHRIAAMRAPLTPVEGMEMLLDDIAKYEAMALRISPGLYNATEAQLAAITDFCFNAGGRAYSTSTLRKRVDTREWKQAAFENNRWVYVTDPKTHEKHRSAWQIKRRAATSKWLVEGVK